MQSTQPAISPAQMQLLLVEDNEDFSYLRELLSQGGDAQLGLDCAKSTEEALVRMAQTPYDLLLCDYHSGDGTALRLLHEVRKDGSGPPVIFLSNHMNEAALDAALKGRSSDLAQVLGLEGPSIEPRSDMPSTSITTNGSAKRLRIRCGSFGTQWSSRQIWL
jgi:CheY-like chemotaxis protein